MLRFLRNLFLNIENKVSLTKVGIFIVTVCTCILTNNLLPDSFDAALKTIISIGGLLSGVGIRDAFDKIGKEKKPAK